ncbi:Os12g0441700, partial [Oryza sativa Japonica Group]
GVARRWRFPVTGCAPSRSDQGLWVELAAVANLMSCAAPASTPLYMAQGDRGPPAIGLGAPDQGAGQVPLEPNGSTGGRSI